MSDRPIVIASNRGPLSFHSDNRGALAARRGAGGLVSGIGPLVEDNGTTWIAAAMSDGDRRVAAQGVISFDGFRVLFVDIAPDLYRMAYDVICNATLWFIHHHLYDLARRPRFDRKWREGWDAYRSMNLTFAEVIVDTAPQDAIVLVQDYHLALVAPLLTASRRDITAVHFSHTPFATPELFRVLPDDVGAVLLEGMASHHACGFHTERWAKAFEQCCEEFIGDTPTTFVAPLSTDAATLRAEAMADDADAELASINDEVGDRKLIVRVDRIELSKNLLRGFHAYDDLLDRHPEWRGKVVFGAFGYPSREGLPEYLSYRQEVASVVQGINKRWATHDWTPILYDQSDNYLRSLAALRRYDVLLVNPIRDGLNLVAKEGPILNEVDGTLVLSPEAGAWEEIGDLALRANPFDVSGTSDALHAALSLESGERKARATALRSRCEQRTPADWLREQRTAAG